MKNTVRVFILSVFFALISVGVCQSALAESAEDFVSYGRGNKLHPFDENYNTIKISSKKELFKVGKATAVSSFEPGLLFFDSGETGLSIEPNWEIRLDAPGGAQIFAGVGVGLLLTNRKFQREGMLFNFTPQAGYGAIVPVKGHKFIFELRWWHASNAGLAKPNGGVNDIVFLVGIGLPPAPNR